MDPLGLIFLGLLLALLVPAVVIDLREQRIPNWNTLAIAALGVLQAAVRGVAAGGPASSVMAALLNAAVASLLLGGSAWLLRRLSSGARMGMGDLKLLVAASTWVGWDGSILMLGLASVLALLVGLAEAPWRGLDLRRVRPFAPMLAVALLAVVTAALLTRSQG